MSKLNPKQKSILLHKQVVLSYLLLLNMDELKNDDVPFKDNILEFIENIEIISKECEELLQAAFNIESVSNSTYLQELAEKVNTVIRKNYQVK